ncbi:MAG: glutamyl-tRNA reductase [Gammaproteobacteria bacterium]|nr:MAG: glutamyl-tRNA reductase [Gammaproteobacteria bacterium]
MSILALGVNHRTASLAMRERLSFSPQDVPMAIGTIRREQLAEEVVMVSTCNRTELYLADVERPQPVYEWMADYRQVALPELKAHSYLYQNEQASRHLFRVATGLDSIALGEPQILGQIKAAYQTSLEHNSVKQTLNRLFQEAFYVAKSIRSDTKLGENSISIAYAASKLSEQFFDDYHDLTALIIGAGQTGELAAKNLKKKGIGKLLIANRTLSKAQNLAVGLGGYAMPLQQLQQHIHEADIIISATGRGEYTVDYNMLVCSQKQRKQRMQLLLDLAVPRDIDPTIQQLSNSYLFAVDDLQSIVDRNQSIRQQAAQQAEALIDDYNRHFNEWLQLRQHHRLLKNVHEYAQAEKDQLTRQAMKRLAKGDDPTQVVNELATRLAKKLTHQPSLLIRQASEKGQLELLDAIKSIYHFD